MIVNGIEVFITEDKKKVIILYKEYVSLARANAIVRYLMDEDFLQKDTVRVSLVKSKPKSI